MEIELPKGQFAVGFSGGRGLPQPNRYLGPSTSLLHS
ncbi:hypothetical protein LINGRAHAP2_LOCUS25179 [Linum grandiflorum]